MPKDNLFSDQLLDELEDEILDGEELDDEDSEDSHKGKDTKNQGKTTMSKEDLELLEMAKSNKALLALAKKNPSLISKISNELTKTDEDSAPPDFDINKAFTGKSPESLNFFVNTIGKIVNNALDNRERYTEKQSSLKEQIAVMKKNYGYDDKKIAELIKLSKEKPLTLEDLHISLNKENIINSIVENLTEEKLLQMKRANAMSLLDGKGIGKDRKPKDVIKSLIDKNLEGTGNHKVDGIDITDFPGVRVDK